MRRARPPRPERAERRRHHRRCRPIDGLRERRARRATPSATPAPTGARWRVRRVATGEELPDRIDVEQVRVGGVDPRRRRLLLRPLPGAAGRRRLRRAEPRHGAALSPARHRSGRRPARVRDAGPSPSGASSPRSPTTAGSSSSPSGAAPIPRTAIYVADLDGRRRGRERAAAARRGRRPLRARSPTIDGDALPAHRPRRAARPRRSRVDVDDPAQLREVIPEGDDALEHVRARRRSARGRRTSTTPTTGSPSSSSTGATSSTSRCRASARSSSWPAAARTTELFLTFMTFAAPAVVLAVSDGRRRGARGRAAGAAVGPGRLRHRAGLRHLRRRHPGPAVPHPPARRRPDRRRPDAAVRLRRLPDRDRPELQARVAGLDGARRPARGRRRCAAAASTARPGTTPGGSANKQNVFDDFAACAALAGGVRLDAPGADRDQRPLERRAARRRQRSPSTRSCSARSSPRSA